MNKSHLEVAIKQARTGLEEGGVPIGAALFVDDTVLGVGRNRRVQMGSVIRHGETDCLENAGRQKAEVYRRATLYTTLSPCLMCAGTILLYGIPRLVVGENQTFETSESLLRERGVEVTVVDDPQCKDLMDRFIEAWPEVWNEDIGEPTA